MKRLPFFDKCSCPATWIVVLAVGITFLFIPALVQSETLLPVKAKGSSEARSDTSNANVPPDRISVLVHLKPGADRGPIRNFARGKGGFIKYEYKTVLPNVVNLRNIPQAAMEALEKVPGVTRVEEDKYHPNLINLHMSTPLIGGLQSQISAAGLSADGSGIRVCVCDTGIDMDHLMYADRIDTAASYDFHNNDSNPEDDNGHGAHVAGIAVGGTGLSYDPTGCEGPFPFQGVAPDATLIGAKILNANGGGYDSNIVAGIDYCADQSPSGGRADVINLSIGKGSYTDTCDSDSWAVAANNAVDAGVVVVAAAGNDGYSNALSTPACGSKVIAVGATYKSDYPNCENSATGFTWCLDLPFCRFTCTDSYPRQDDHVCFSNNSSNLDVVAPGSVIWSASTAAGGGKITEMSGTSQASPHVAGLAALILDSNSALNPEQVRQYIRDGALDKGTPGFDNAYGYGRIDVIETLQLAGTACGDGLCDPGEDPCSCEADCGSPPSTETSCSDGIDDDCDGSTDCEDSDCDTDPDCVCNNNDICEPGEDCDNCPNDCIGSDGVEAVCGNGVCEPGSEDCISCPDDCAGRQTGKPANRFCCGGSYGCDDPGCNDAGYSCGGTPSPYCCGDGSCEVPEDSYNCEVDCGSPPYCGDDFCDPDEDPCSCPEDCGTPPTTETDCSDGIDDDCDGYIDCSDSDCSADPACSCLPRKSECSDNSECCSNRCRRGTCK